MDYQVDTIGKAIRPVFTDLVTYILLCTASNAHFCKHLCSMPKYHNSNNMQRLLKFSKGYLSLK